MKHSTINNTPLRWDEFQWIGEIKLIPFSKKPIEINIGSEDEVAIVPHTAQAIVLNDFIENGQTIYTVVIQAIFDYYMTIRPQYESTGTEWIINMPVIVNPSQLESMITLNYIAISYPYKDADVQIGLSYSCVWDVEHGLGVVLTTNKIIEVGFADCAII